MPCTQLSISKAFVPFMHMHAAPAGVAQVPGTTLPRSLTAPYASGMLGAASSLHHCLRTISWLRRSSITPAHRVSLPRAVGMTAAARTEPAPVAQKGLSLENLKFDNRFTEDLPADDKKLNRLREVGAVIFAVAGAKLLSGLRQLELSAAFMRSCSPLPPLACQVENAVYTWVEPTPTETEPHTLAASREVAKLIGLDLDEIQRPEFAAIFSGNAPLPGSRPYAQCYGGHQFGYWAGQVRAC